MQDDDDDNDDEVLHFIVFSSKMEINLKCELKLSLCLTD
jgi:hypothetical protein